MLLIRNLQLKEAKSLAHGYASSKGQRIDSISNFEVRVLITATVGHSFIYTLVIRFEYEVCPIDSLC